MSVTRRSALASAAYVIAGFPGSALAQPWPQRPVRIVVGFQAGGTGDVVARLVGDRVAPLLGTSIVIENKPGGSGVAAANSVRTIQDDRTLLMVSETYVVTPLINRNAGFDIGRDFKLVASLPKVLTSSLRPKMRPSRRSRSLPSMHGRRRPGLTTRPRDSVIRSISSASIWPPSCQPDSCIFLPEVVPQQ